MAEKLALQETNIPGFFVVDLLVHEDTRGSFKENYNKAKLEDLGLPEFEIVQNNVSFNKQVGVTRGLHAEPWEKYISVGNGRIFGAWVDLRDGDSFGQTFTMEITPDKAVYVPRGVANGYQTLTEDVVYTYLINDHWSQEAKAKYTFVNLFDKHVAIDWPIPEDQAIVSDDDKNHPTLDKVTPMVV
jgi:dTDP-4-dehydrorhamnose 3,5-epimerase